MGFHPQSNLMRMFFERDNTKIDLILCDICVCAKKCMGKVAPLYMCLKTRPVEDLLPFFSLNLNFQKILQRFLNGRRPFGRLRDISLWHFLFWRLFIDERYLYLNMPGFKYLNSFIMTIFYDNVFICGLLFNDVSHYLRSSLIFVHMSHTAWWKDDSYLQENNNATRYGREEKQQDEEQLGIIPPTLPNDAEATIIVCAAHQSDSIS